MAKKIEIKGPIVSNTSGWVYDWLGWDSAYPKALQKALEEADGDDVILEVNSNGGLATAGFEMYKIIKDYPGKVTVHLINAMSAASFIVCAADEALASDAAILMIHNTQCYAEGDYRDMEMEADALKEFNQGIINVYMRKTGMSQEKLQELMDHDTHMSPQKAIQYGFIDGYIYGDPEESKGKDQDVSGMVVVNATVPIITDDKAHEIMSMLQGEGVAGKLQELLHGKDSPTNRQKEDIGFKESDSNTNQNEGGTKNMTLEEFLQENPEAKAELDERIQNAKKEGVTNERKRLEELDAISSTVTPEALSDAKYGDDPMDAKELAYQAMKDEKLRMTSYMSDAVDDSKESGVEDVGAGSEEETEDESVSMANYVNQKKGGKKR